MDTTTEKLPAIRFDRLRKVVESLEAVPAKLVDMGFWGGGCGTSACAVGHYCNNHPRAQLRFRSEELTLATQRTYSSFGAVSIYFGLERRETEWLFGPESYSKDWRLWSGGGIKRRVLIRINKFIATKGKSMPNTAR